VLVLLQGRALDVGRVCILGALAATVAAALPKYDTVVVTIKEKVQNVAAAALSALLPWAACVAHLCCALVCWWLGMEGQGQGRVWLACDWAGLTWHAPAVPRVCGVPP
jgi:hypothetical protein